jgi:hypothetical protein
LPFKICCTYDRNPTDKISRNDNHQTWIRRPGKNPSARRCLYKEGGLDARPSFPPVPSHYSPPPPPPPPLGSVSSFEVSMPNHLRSSPILLDSLCMLVENSSVR